MGRLHSRAVSSQRLLAVIQKVAPAPKLNFQLLNGGPHTLHPQRCRRCRWRRFTAALHGKAQLPQRPAGHVQGVPPLLRHAWTQGNRLSKADLGVAVVPS